MSWISENYEKAALGGAAIVAVALVALSVKSHSDAAAEYELELPTRNNDGEVSGLPVILQTDSSFKSDHGIVRPVVDDRKVDLFTSVPIVIKKGSLTEPIDLLKGATVHEGIENRFWVKYGIDAGHDNSPDLDPDADGFTNMDECIAGTSPIDYNSHPDPVLKLVAVNVATEQVHIKPTYYNGKSTFRLENKKKRRLNRTTLDPIGAGQVISFTEDLMKERFKFISVQGADARSRVWTIEDLKPNKKGVIYKFDKKGNIPGDPKRDFGIMDSTLELKLVALNESGKSFKVEENNTFELPIKGGAEKKTYLFKSIDLNDKKALIEYKAADGSTATQAINF